MFYFLRFYSYTTFLFPGALTPRQNKILVFVTFKKQRQPFMDKIDDMIHFMREYMRGLSTHALDSKKQT